MFLVTALLFFFHTIQGFDHILLTFITKKNTENKCDKIRNYILISDRVHLGYSQ